MLGLPLMLSRINIGRISRCRASISDGIGVAMILNVKVLGLNQAISRDPSWGPTLRVMYLQALSPGLGPGSRLLGPTSLLTCVRGYEWCGTQMDDLDIGKLVLYHIIVRRPRSCDAFCIRSNFTLFLRPACLEIGDEPCPNDSIGRLVTTSIRA